MREAVLAEQYDMVFMAAAVSDYRPLERRAGKVKKGLGSWTLEMERTPDILAELSTSVVRPELLIGFAAETHDIERYAREKLRAKALDGIVANDVGAGGAFGSDTNRVQCYDGAGGMASFGPAAKQEIAAAIVAWADGCWARKQ
jgi:phosphopantothenoylcysteine decarboxylase/phosphopantothenate--cysteine ligase